LVWTLLLGLGTSCDAETAGGDAGAVDAGPTDVGVDIGVMDLGPSIDFGPVDMGRDRTPPTVVSSAPAEGAEMIPTGSTMVSITFSEAMDPSNNQAPTRLTSMFGGGNQNLTGMFSSSDCVVTFGLNVEAATDYSMDLSGFTDAAGNRLDGTVLIMDGRLDFSSR
jgi:hypothetical protein